MASKYKTFNYEGTVTAVNFSFCQFTIDIQHNVLVCDVYHPTGTGLPKIGEKVKIINAYIVEHDYIYISKDSQISCSSFQYSAKSERFCDEYLNIANFTIPDVYKINKYIIKYKKLNVFSEDFITYRTLYNSTDVYDIFLNIFGLLPKRFKSINYHNSNYEDYQFIFPVKYKSEDSVVYSNNLEKLTFEIQRSSKNNIFIGYLTYKEKTNHIYLVDAKHDILCVILNKNKSVYEFMEQFVIIKKFYYIAELYKENLQKLEYLTCNMNDIEVLKFPHKISNLMIENYHKCIVWHKCPPYYHSFKKAFEFWLYVEFQNYKCVLSSVHFAKIYHLINIGSELRINFNEYFKFPEDLSKYEFNKNIEINRIFKNFKIFKLSDEVRIEVNNNLNHTEHIKPIEEVMKTIKFENNMPISFMARIHSKSLKPPLASRTAPKQKVKNEMFGTSGSETHLLTLEDINNPTFQMKLYINNYENSHCPLGLIPGMVVNVRYALRQKNYLKSCMVTHFDPIDYRPDIDLATKFDFAQDWDWGQPSMLSQIKDAPATARIWGHMYEMDIQKIEFSSLCNHCKCFLSHKQKNCCEKEDFSHIFKFNFAATDEEGTTDIFTDKLSVFKTLFNLSEIDVTGFLKIMIDLRYYIYEPEQASDDQTQISEPTVTLDEYLDTFLSCYHGIMTDLHLRVQTSQENNFSEQWYCTEARDATKI